jgi:excinuclease ABC subunit B
MYGDVMTDSMKKAIAKTEHRRAIQEAFNTEHGITPTTVIKPVEEAIRGKETKEMAARYLKKKSKMNRTDKSKLIADLEAEMREAAKILDFERAAELRDMLFELKSED